MEKRLPPDLTTNKDWEPIEEAIVELFRKEIYNPILKIIAGETASLKNAKEDLARAIAEGKISYSDGRFTGKFDSKTSSEIKRLGGTWEKGGWNLPQSRLPSDIQRSIEVSLSRMERVLSRIDEILRKILPEKIAEKLQFRKLFDTTLWKHRKKISDNIKAISVKPQMSKERQSFISQQYAENMQLSIKGWADEEIKKLRKDIIESTFKGDRYEGMVDVIQTRYQVSKAKAKFLARNETNLLLAKYKQSRYTDAGVTEYIWRNVKGSAGHPVRHMHKTLDRKRFRWDNPPITNPQGNRNHPGEDYNCRCFAIPIVQLKTEKS